MPEPYEYADALPTGPVRGRGAGVNPGNRFEAVRLHVLGEHLDEQAKNVDGPPALPATTILPDHTRTIINYVDPKASPDIGFRWTINPYRGCEHGCIYCYARPGHEYLGMTSGIDFETKIMAKHDAPRLLRRELADPKWQGETIVMSGVTDCYQPIEKELGITRGCLEVLAECRQPVGIVTKSRLVLRDLDLLRELARHGAVSVAVSLTSLDNRLAAKMEPRASSPKERLDAIAQLSAAGIPVAVMTAPIVPGLNDQELPALLRAAAEAGAKRAGWVMLRLPWQIKALFEDWARRQFPERAERMLNLLRDARGGKLYDATHGKRMKGEGPVAEQIGKVFGVFARKYGLTGRSAVVTGEHFRRPMVGGQGWLFE